MEYELTLKASVKLKEPLLTEARQILFNVAAEHRKKQSVLKQGSSVQVSFDKFRFDPNCL